MFNVGDRVRILKDLREGEAGKLATVTAWYDAGGGYIHIDGQPENHIMIILPSYVKYLEAE